MRYVIIGNGVAGITAAASKTGVRNWDFRHWRYELGVQGSRFRENGRRRNEIGGSRSSGLLVNLTPCTLCLTPHSFTPSPRNIESRLDGKALNSGL